jgi:cyclic-di-AMP phosphodiesterase
VLPQLKNKKDKENKVEIRLDTGVYSVTVKPEERLLYIHDITAQTDLQQRFQESKPAIGVVLLDNLDEATQGMDDQFRSMTMAKVTGQINEWAQQNGMFLRRTASDRYLMVMDQKALHKLEHSRFDILDDVRDSTLELKVPFTLSIGVASGSDSLIELGTLAQTSLDIALGRGGDQAAVKIGQRLSFYGGRSNAVEKRTRVRARVISHALRDLIRESDRVLIMGHRIPDMDAIGAAVGVWKAVQLANKEGYVVLEGLNPSIQKLMDLLAEEEKYKRCFISPDHALSLKTPRTLVVVVDTHKATLTPEPKLLQNTNRIVVVDHHRRGEEFISDAVLIYMEPYASSTCELVTELLQYFQDRVALDVMEATALLAGIAVDTKNFTMRTGARTFEAASFLRRNGADTAIIHRMLKEDLDSYVKKAEVIKHAEIMYEHIAIAVTEPGRKYSQLLIAQVADTLVNMTDIMASFVIAERQDGLIGISARSHGQINVQVVMERLGGGGHLTNAAVQLEHISVHEAAKRLKQVLNEIDTEEGLFE